MLKSSYVKKKRCCNRTMKKTAIVIMPIIVVFLGVIGYLLEGNNLYSSLLSSVQFVTLNWNPLPANILVEIARWLGILFLFGLIYSAILAVIESGLAIAKSSRKDAVAVHGDSIYAEMLLKALGKRGIKTDNRVAFKAPRQIILFENDNQAIDFYQKHANDFSKAEEVHLCLNLGNLVSLEKDNVIVTNMSEIRAIDYWKNNYCIKKENITIIGSGQLAESVLYWGLLTNVFDVKCENNYLVFGDFEKFLAMHCDFEKTIKDYGEDTICFSKGDWYANLEAVKRSNRIIICGDTMDNVELALDMKTIGIKCPIHLFAENGMIDVFVDESTKIVGTLSKENIKEVLMMDSIHLAGKKCHATYLMLEKSKNTTANAEELSEYLDSPEFIDSWKELDSFTRNSNYATAIHDPVKNDLLKLAGIDVAGLTVAENRNSYNQLTEEIKHRLQEIEHIRWCRYHLLNNWRKPNSDIIINGEQKAKDNSQRLHANLVPYNELSLDDQMKDAYYFQTLAIRGYQSD